MIYKKFFHILVYLILLKLLWGNDILHSETHYTSSIDYSGIKRKAIHLRKDYSKHQFLAGTAAKFEPPNGKVYHGVGQQNKGVEEYITALNDSTIHPIINKFYFDIPGARGPKFEALRSMLSTEKSIGRIPELSIAFQGQKGSTDDTIALESRYDFIIDSLASIVRDFHSAIFIRPGFEFNGPWNGYHPSTYVKAFRKIVDRFRVMKAVDSAAFIWCYYAGGNAADDFDEVNSNENKWYPGTDYVDWFGLDVFNSSDFDPDLPDFDNGEITTKGKSSRFIFFAATEMKPVFLSEVTAKGVQITPDQLDGEADWKNWFVPFWSFLNQNPEIKGYCYINWNWTEYDQWKDWGNARIENNSYILGQYKREMKKPRYIHLYGSNELTLPEKVILKSPVDNDEIEFTDFTKPPYYIQLSWDESYPDITRYNVQVALDENFSNIVFEDSLKTRLFHSFEFSEPKEYFWRCRAGNDLGWGDFSETWAFSTRITSINDPLTDNTRLFDPSPNPVTESSLLGFYLDCDSHVSISLINMLGQEQKIIFDGNLSGGEHSIIFERGNLPDGQYILFLRNGLKIMNRIITICN